MFNAIVEAGKAAGIPLEIVIGVLAFLFLIGLGSFLYSLFRKTFSFIIDKYKNR